MTSKTRKIKRTQTKQVKYVNPVKTVSIKKNKSGFYKFFFENHKKLMIIPIALLLFSLIILVSNYSQNGEFINKGVSIRGGTEITIPSQSLEVSDVKTFLLSSFPEGDFNIRSLSVAGVQTDIIIEATDIDIKSLTSTIEANFNVKEGEYNVNSTGSSLGQSFYKQIIVAIIAAFILMGIVVYIYFRKILPSISIIIAAASNMIITLGFVSLTDMRITTAGIAAFLMLIGYSVDTNILLTTRVLKVKEGTLNDKIYSAMKTGMTMSVTTIIAITVALFIAQSDVIKQIMIILLVGLIADIFNTWIQNTTILKMFMEKKLK